MKQPCLYVLASKRNGTLYVGVTSDLVQRVWQHRTNEIDGFTKQYCVHLLVYFEFYAAMEDAIQREKRVKHWRRTWKIALIEQHNLDWHDLYPGLVPGIGSPLSRG
jgi:putative endonuclease